MKYIKPKMYMNSEECKYGNFINLQNNITLLIVPLIMPYAYIVYQIGTSIDYKKEDSKC